MGIDVSLYKRGDTAGDYNYIDIPEVQLREHASIHNYYAITVLFEEAFNGNKKTRPLKPRPEILQARLPATLDTIAKRARNLPDHISTESRKKYERQQKELFKKFVQVYTEEYNKGNDPVIHVW